MFQHTRNTSRHPSGLIAGAVAMTIVVSAAMPAAYAHEPVMGDSKSMPMEQMDHSKMSGMKGMDGMKHMQGMSMTGDADFDFATNMRMHHQMALDMAQAQISNGKNAKMVSMARSIKTSQTKEIAKFDQFIAAHNSATGRQMPKDK